MSVAQKVGELNGPWSILLRLALASYPLVLAWTVWITVQTFENQAFRVSGERFTQNDGLKLRADLLDLISRLPAQDWRDRIVAIEVNQAAMLKSLTRIETKLETGPR